MDHTTANIPACDVKQKANPAKAEVAIPPKEPRMGKESKIPIVAFPLLIISQGVIDWEDSRVMVEREMTGERSPEAPTLGAADVADISATATPHFFIFRHIYLSSNIQATLVNHPCCNSISAKRYPPSRRHPSISENGSQTSC